MKSLPLERAAHAFLALCFTALAPALPAHAVHESPGIIATIPLARNAPAIAVNELTNRAYVVSSVGNNVVSVIDGASNAITATVPLGTPSNVSGWAAVAVDETTNRIYVVGSATTTMFVIDGDTNALVDTVQVGDAYGVAVNERTGLIYVTNYASGTVTVVDRDSHATAAVIAVGNDPQGVAANAATNSIYVVNHMDHTVSVIDGAAHAVVATVPVGLYPWNVAVNPRTNRMYVTDQPANVSVIDGSTNTVVATVPVGIDLPFGADVNVARNLVYVMGGNYSGLVVIDGATDTVWGTYPLGAGARAISLNERTDLLYVADYGNSRVLVLGDITLEMLGDDVQELVPVPLNEGQANGLTGHLARAIRLLAEGDEDGAARALEAFLAQVSGFLRAGLLSWSEAESLTNRANSILDSLRR